MTLSLPNLRQFLIPDPGFTLVDLDMKGADARVVAWEAEDEQLKDAFRNGLPIHAVNAKSIWPEELKDVALHEVETKNYLLYHRSKTAVHAVNYGCKARTLAEHINTSTFVAENFINTWLLTLHPGIRRWHQDTDYNLRRSGSVSNKFGYKRTYFDRPDGLLPKALAWIGQSTTACAVNRALVNVHKNLPNVRISLQTHDSLTCQVRTDELNDVLPALIKQCTIVVPYEDPLEMAVSVKVSNKSWGDVKEWKN